MSELPDRWIKNRMPAKPFVILALVLGLAACTPGFRNHGYIPVQEDLDALVIGVDTRASVEDTLGPPSASGVQGEDSYYYVRSRVRTVGFRRPKVIEREVLAIRFDAQDAVSNIERFGLQDGKVVVLERRVTTASVSDRNFLRQLLGNFGRFSLPGSL